MRRLQGERDRRLAVQSKEQEQAAQRVAEDKPAFVEDYANLQPNEKRAWLSSLPELREIVEDQRSLIAQDLADLLGVDTSGWTEEFVQDREKMVAALLDGSRGRSLIESAKKTAYEAGFRAGETEARKRGGYREPPPGETREPGATAKKIETIDDAFAELRRVGAGLLSN